MVWYSHLLKNFPQFVVIHTVKVFHIENEVEVDVSLEFPTFLCDPVNECWQFDVFPLLFLNSACTYGTSQFTYY